MMRQVSFWGEISLEDICYNFCSLCSQESVNQMDDFNNLVNLYLNKNILD